jgi:hypothetical protein
MSSMTTEYDTPYGCNASDTIKINSNAKFDRIYLISGLRRSGNHLLLQILNCSFDENSILFINDFPSMLNDDIDNQEEQFDLFKTKKEFRKFLVTISYGSSTFKCSSGIGSTKLLNKNIIDDLENQSQWTVQEKKILIMSFEDQYIFRMNEIADSLKQHSDNIFKIIAIRDILNCFSSRIKAQCDRNTKYDGKIEPVFKKNVERGGYFKTDFETVKIWKEHLYKCYYKNDTNDEYIVFNYNNFLCSDENKRKIFDKLEIPYNSQLFQYTSTFGQGSSFGSAESVVSPIVEYFGRFGQKICEKQLTVFFKSIFTDKILINEYLKKYFNMELIPSENNTYNLKICDVPEPIIVDMSEIMTGGNAEIYYKHKYIKYKNKYNGVKHLHN